MAKKTAIGFGINMTQYHHNNNNGGDEQYYNYCDDAYLHMALHRRITHYDPRNTTHEMVLEAFRNAEKANNHRETIPRLLFVELQKEESPKLASLPIGLQMVFHEINLAWIDVITQMLFVDGMTETFYSEYCHILNNIVCFDTPYAKETMVYRYHNNGETIFHLAGKMWLIYTIKKMKDQSQLKIAKEISRQTTTILSSYGTLGKCFGQGMGDCILSLRDFTGKPLKEFLMDYSEEICDINET